MTKEIESRVDSQADSVDSPTAASVAPVSSELVDGYDATFWHGSYMMLRDAVVEHLEDCIHDDDIAEEAICIEAIATAGGRLRELLAALKHAENHCPCGARPESPHTHPHVGMCPIGNALAKAEGR